MMRPPELIIRNSIRCTACNAEIVSEHRHDFRGCTCGKCSVDGGHTYLRRLGSTWVDTSVVAIRELDHDPHAAAESIHFLDRIREGWQVSSVTYADAPLLEGWRPFEIYINRQPWRVLVGHVSEHSEFEDGQLIATTPVLKLDDAGEWVRTTRRFYRLRGRQQ